MNSRMLPWLKLWWSWPGALLVFILSITILVWEVASPKARQASLEEQCRELQASVLDLERANEAARAEREHAATVSSGLQDIYQELFGSLDERMTAILRAIGSAARDSGLLPGSFSYSSEKAPKTGSLRFHVDFSVEGTYEQVRQLLQALQSSPQFLIIDGISFKGEEDPRSNLLHIRLAVSTSLSDTDSSNLQAIVQRLGLPEEAPPDVSEPGKALEPEQGKIDPSPKAEDGTASKEDGR